MIIFNKLDNYFVVSANSQTFLGFEMTANFRDTSPLSIPSKSFAPNSDSEVWSGLFINPVFLTDIMEARY